MDYCKTCLHHYSDNSRCKGCSAPQKDGEICGEPSYYINIKVRPPLGLKPRYIWETERIKDIIAAMHRYSEAGEEIPKEWVTELQELTARQRDNDELYIDDFGVNESDLKIQYFKLVYLLLGLTNKTLCNTKDTLRKLAFENIHWIRAAKLDKEYELVKKNLNNKMPTEGN